MLHYVFTTNCLSEVYIVWETRHHIFSNLQSSRVAVVSAKDVILSYNDVIITVGHIFRFPRAIFYDVFSSSRGCRKDLVDSVLSSLFSFVYGTSIDFYYICL